MTSPPLPRRVPADSPLTSEPVATAELVRAVLVVLVSLGWLTIDNATVNVIASVLGLALSWVLTALARNRVTPMSTLKKGL